MSDQEHKPDSIKCLKVAGICMLSAMLAMLALRGLELYCPAAAKVLNYQIVVDTNKL